MLLIMKLPINKMSNFHLQTPDDKFWLANDDWRYTYHHMEWGYTKELLSEEEMKERYGDFMKYVI